MMIGVAVLVGASFLASFNSVRVLKGVVVDVAYYYQKTKTSAAQKLQLRDDDDIVAVIDIDDDDHRPLYASGGGDDDIDSRQENDGRGDRSFDDGDSQLRGGRWGDGNDDGDDEIDEERRQRQRQQQQQRQGQRSRQGQQPQFDDMNIVLLYADDWTWRTLGAINPIVKTPHLDAMARRGVLFTHNCVTTSICWQSRASLMTSLYVAVHQHVKIGSTSMFNETVQWPLTLYPLLKSAGYHTALIGKWHADLPEAFEAQTFDYFDNYYGEHWMERGGKMRHVTDLNREDALTYLRHTRPKDRKFALTVSFFATHSCTCVVVDFALCCRCSCDRHFGLSMVQSPLTFSTLVPAFFF